MKINNCFTSSCWASPPSSSSPVLVSTTVPCYEKKNKKAMHKKNVTCKLLRNVRLKGSEGKNYKDCESLVRNKNLSFLSQD